MLRFACGGILRQFFYVIRHSIRNSVQVSYLVIGVDCAVQPADVGLARLRGKTGSWYLDAVTRGSPTNRPAQVAAEWIHEEQGSVLLALDAPLGWPASMGKSLQEHTAGSGIDVPANDLFRRATDRFIKDKFRKTPLDIGADRIARTALWAVNFLQDLRQRLSAPIPLAWGVPLPERISAIEVYPAATLLAHEAELTGYKAAAGAGERSDLYKLLQTRFNCSAECEIASSSPHLIDAAICTLAAVDFLEGHAANPTDLELAKREGWIWARPRELRSQHEAVPSSGLNVR